MNERQISQTFRKPGKVRLDLGVGMLVGNKRISEENCKDMMKEVFGEVPSSLSRYIELADATVQRYSGEISKRYHQYRS